MNIDVNIQLSHMLASDIGHSGEESAIIDVIHSINRPVTRESIVADIEEVFHISLSRERTMSILRKMIAENKLSEIGNQLQLSPTTLELLNQRILENEKIEQTALSQWVDGYAEFDKTVCLSPTQQNALKEVVRGFIACFFLTHGAGCYDFITGAKNNDTEKLDEMASGYTNKINESSNLYSIRAQIALYLPRVFSINKTAEQESFLLFQLRKAVHYLSMVVDRPTMDALINSLEGITVYLDTSIIYRLLNLQGEQRYTSTNQLFNFCKSAKMSIKVFQCTVEELNRRIAYDSAVIIKHPMPVSFASIGYKSRTDENYISTYWKARAQTGISAEDFNFQYADILATLDYFGIEVDDRQLDDLEDLPVLRAKVRSFGQFADGDEKTENAVDHDAECLSRIATLQRKNAKSVIESGVFLLSTDWSLIRLQRYDHDYKNRTDAVVLPSQLMQLFCLSTPKEDYFEAFLGLFSSAHIGFGTNRLNNEQVQDIMGRVAYYSERPDFMKRVLFNQLIQSKFGEQESEEEQSAMVDEAVREEIEKLEAENEEVSTKLLESQSAVDAAQQNLADQQQINKKQREEHEQMLFDLRQAFEQKKKENEIAIAKLQADRSKEQEDHSQRNARYEQEIAELRQYQNREEQKKLRRFLFINSALLVLFWILFGLGIVFIIAGIIPLIPPVANVTQVFFSWLFSRLNWQSESPITIAAYLVGIGVADIPFSLWIINMLKKSRMTRKTQILAS